MHEALAQADNVPAQSLVSLRPQFATVAAVLTEAAQYDFWNELKVALMSPKD